MTTNETTAPGGGAMFGQRVNGKAEIGDTVRYHDIANQNGPTYEVVGLPQDYAGQYALRNVANDDAETSDLRQYGWTFVPRPAEMVPQPVDSDEDEDECEGHPAGPFDPMGVTVYCDGTCRAVNRAGRHTR